MRIKSILRLSALGLGGLLIGTLPATAARAATPTSAAEAQAKAEHYREQADRYRAQGGVGYKSGAVRRAETSARKYDTLAETLAPTTVTIIRSSEADRYANLAARYRLQGGVAYKAGLVQAAEAQQRYQEAGLGATATPESRTACVFGSKPPVQWLACATE